MRIDADPDPKLSFTPRLYTEISINFLAELDTRQRNRASGTRKKFEKYIGLSV